MERICWQKKTTWPLSESQWQQQPKWSLTVQASSYRNYLMKNNKITRKNKSQANLDNFVLRERLVDKDSWQRYDYHQGDTSGISYRLTMLEYNWIEISMILLPQHRFKYTSIKDSKNRETPACIAVCCILQIKLIWHHIVGQSKPTYSNLISLYTNRTKFLCRLLFIKRL